MNLITGKGSMSTASSASARKSADMVSDQFPAGLRVLVVDDDPTCLMILEKMLRICLYEVTKCNRAEMALQLLRQNKNGFDIVLSDVHMPDMDGFQLLVDIGLEMDLPVIMMSADDSKHVVMKGVTHGACDYLIKPVRIEALKNIWQHVIRKKKNDVKDMEQSGSADEGDRLLKPSEDADYSSSANEGNWRNAKKRKDEDEEAEDRDDTSSLKKPRVVWSVELHQQFVGAVEQLGIDKAVPKKILELMNVPGLTRENVASHLQKYRLYLRRLHGNPQHGTLSNSFITQQEPTFAPMSSLNGLDLQTLAATGQLPGQSLSTFQTSSGLRSTVKPSIPVTLEQRNSFSFDNPKLRFGDGQQQPIASGKPMNLLHGISTNMEPKQLVNLHQSVQSLGNMDTRLSAPGGQSNTLLMQMAQQQPRRQIVNESLANQISGFPSSVGQAIMPIGLSSGRLSRNGIPNNRTAPSSYNPVSQNSTTLNYPMSHPTEMQVHNFPFGSMQRMPNSQKKVSLPQDFNTSMKGPQDYLPSYNMFSEMNQQKPNDWELQNAGLNFHASQLGNPSRGNMDVSPSVLVQHGFSSVLQNGQNRQNIGVGKSMISHTEGMQQTQHISQPCVPLVENPARAKAERVADAIHASVQNSFFSEQFGQDDLMSALLKQEGVGSVDNDFEFDRYSLDNIPV